MELLSRSADLFVHVAFWTVVHSLWQGALFAVALAVWRRFADGRDYAARSAAATLTLAFLAAAPVATAALLANSYEPPQQAAVEAPLETQFTSETIVWNQANGEVDGALVPAEPTPLVDAEWLTERLPQAIALLWTIGVTCGCVRLVASATRLQLVRWRATLPDAALAARCGELARRCGLTRPPRLLRSGSARGPYTFGLFRPCIVFPAAWALETTPEALEAAVAHELAHLKRRDLWVLALQRLVETALFYHPGVWYVSRTLDVERERAADRLAAEVLGDPARYAESLYRLASLAVEPGAPALTLPFHGETRMKLLERVRHVLRSEEAKSGGAASVGWLCLAPALLAAIFLGQAAFAGSLRADDSEREGDSTTADAEDDRPDGRDDDEAKDRDEEDAEDEGRREEEQEERDDDDAGDRDVRESEGRQAGIDEVRRRFAEEKARMDEALRQEAQALERKYKAHIQAAQEELARAMEELQAKAQARTKELEVQVAQLIAQREAEAQTRAEEERERGDNRERLQGDDADDLTPRERRMLGIIRSLEARLQELEGRGPRVDRRDREDDAREESDRRRSQERDEGDGEDGNLKESAEQERQEREADRREAEQREGDREDEGRGEEASEGDRRQEALRLQPRSEEEAKERQFGALAERLYAALRSDDLAEERRAEFARRVVLDVFGYELNEEQVQTVLERSRGDFPGFRQLLARLSQAKKE